MVVEKLVYLGSVNTHQHKALLTSYDAVLSLVQ